MSPKAIGTQLLAVFVCLGWFATAAASALEFPRLSSTSCTGRFYRRRTHVVLDVNATFSLVERSDIHNSQDCRDLCLQYKECRSATFRAFGRSRTCFLNRANNRDDGFPTRRVYPWLKITIYERDCSVPNAALTSCSMQFDPEIPNTVLNVRQSHSLRQHDNVLNIESCMELCLSHDACRSVTYQQSKLKCYLNTVNHRDDEVDRVEVDAELTMTLVERICSEPLCGIQGPQYAPKTDSHRVVGGEEANPHSWPWMVALMDGNNTRCGGSILSRRWIVTAAHCVREDPIFNPSLTVMAGAHHKRQQEECKRIYTVSRIHMHPGFGHSGHSHDLALIELETELEYTDEILPICLPKTVVEAGQECVTTGWGRTRGTGDNSVLNQVHVPLIPYDVCSRPSYYGPRVDEDTMICAGYEMGIRDACKGDSGGPLMCYDEKTDNLSRYRLCGVTSWGKGCARARKPGVYTNVLNYIDWIQITTNNAAQIP